MNESTREVRFGKAELSFTLKQVAPIIISYIIVGISFGILAYDAGLDLMWVFLSSLIVYSGAGQISLVALLKAGTPLPVLTILGIAISARFAFYGIFLIDRYRASGKYYPYLVFGLTDEAYSLMVGMDYPQGINENGVNIMATGFIHIAWILGSVLGHIFGQAIGIDIEGLDFMLTAFFITVVIGQYKSGSRFSIIAGIVCSLVSLVLIGPDNFIVVAIVLTIICILIEGKLRGSGQGDR